MSNKTGPSPMIRTTFLAVMSLLMTVAVVASLTFALFVKDLDDNTVHIQAGDLEISATYVKLEGTRMDTNSNSATYGKLIAIPTNEQTKDIDLTENEESIFNIENAVPTLTQTATIGIANGGTIAFDYEIHICDLVMTTSDADADRALASQILITLQSGNNTVEFILDQCGDDANKLALGELAPGAEASVTVTALFLNDADNDFGIAAGDNMDAANGGVSFDITIIATQSIA